MSKASEIKRLTTPITFNNSKAYDHEGNLLKCVETLSEVRFPIEPDESLLSDDEILQYSPQSKAASQVRLKRGFGELSDALLVNESIPWILALYYVVLICVFIPVSYANHRIALVILLILAVIPLIYAYQKFNLKHYSKQPKVKKVEKNQNTAKAVAEEAKPVDYGVESLKDYEKEANNLKVLFDVKEEVVKDLINKRFEPPQITNDKFIAMVESSHKLFYAQHDGVVNIVRLAAEDTPRIRSELDNKIDSMKAIINQIENLTNELVININEEDSTTEEINHLLEEMGNYIDAIKEY